MASTIPHDPRHVAPAVEVKLPSWHANAAAIGVTPALVDEVQALYDEAVAKMAAADAARNAARNATIEFHTAAEALRSKAAAVVGLVRGYAELTADADVYALASIAPPRKPSRRLPPPGTPSVHRIALVSGRVEIGWTADHPAGVFNVVYQVSRIMDGGEPEHVGSTGERSFLDHTLPPRALQVEYLITAQRGSQRSAPGRSSVLLLYGDRMRPDADVTVSESRARAA